ncbi:origin recognition complex subunit 5-like [Clavelina lepadiformis]|uniref:origin recognition complex subunit 5-like n=1 Tax=Clavelina lepadiformis TaxID=159417 RepID=UPI004041731B
MSVEEVGLPARQKQVQQLTTLFHHPSHSAVPSIFIYGHSSTGKSVTLSHVLKTRKLTHVIVNCVECYTTSLLFLEVLRSFSSNEESIWKCDNMNDFVRNLRKILSKSEEAVYIVFDKAESLRDRNVNILPAIMNLQELTSCNLCVILVSELPWEKFYNGIGLRDPFIIFFPDYTKEELVEVLCHLRSPDTDLDFYRHYVTMVLAVFFLACRDLRELRHLAEMNFSIYKEPIEKGVATVNDKHKLWKNLEPHLRSALQKLYMREVSSDEWEKLQSKSSETALVKRQNIVELPFYSKFILISAYLASYNPAKTDRRFFVKNAGKMKRTAHSMKKDEKKSAHLRGPHAFPLDRMMAIFYSIVDGRVPPTANIFAQISSLVSLRFLSQIGHEDQIDSPRYKCIVSLEFITSIAKTVNFEIIRYLFDFV